MNTTFKIFKYEFKNIARSKWTVAFIILYFIMTQSLFMFESEGSKVLLSLFNFILLIVPIISLFYGITFLNNEKAFIELLLSQPIERKSIFNGLFGGLAGTLSLSLLIGVGVPIIFNSQSSNISYDLFIIFLLVSLLMTIVFTAISAFAAFRFADRAKGLIFVITFWLCTFIIYDALFLLISYLLQDYPTDKIMIGLVMLNPVDVARIIIVLQFDIAALLGYSAAIYQQAFGSFAAIFILFGLLCVWCAAPFYIARRRFCKHDFIIS